MWTSSEMFKIGQSVGEHGNYTLGTAVHSWGTDSNKGAICAILI